MLVGARTKELCGEHRSRSEAAVSSLRPRNGSLMFAHEGSRGFVQDLSRNDTAVEHTQALCQSHLWQRRWKPSPPGDFPVTQHGK